MDGCRFFFCFDGFLGGGDVSIHRSEVGSRCLYIYIYVIFVAEKNDDVKPIGFLKHMERAQGC